MRLTHRHILPAAAPIGITFDGRPLSALPGETVAATLSAHGIRTFRHTAAGAPRGLWCGMGACFDCLVTIDGRANQRACLAKVAAGMVVLSAPPAPPEPAAPDAGGGQGEARPLAPEPHAAAETLTPDILVVGAGPAGLAAAIAAAGAGCAVLVLDERDAPGGQYLKPLASSHAHAAPDRQFRQSAAMRDQALQAGVVFHHGATVWGAFAADELGVLIEGRNVVARPRRLILAPGSHERPVPIPGWTLPGVMTTGAMQTLARANRVSPGRRVVVAGNGPLNLQLACELVEGGVTVAAVLEAAPKPGFRTWREAVGLAASAPDLAWDGVRYLAVLRRAGVPVVWSAMVQRVEEAGAALAVHAGTAAGEARFEADAVALNHGFQPETGLARALGCAHRFVDSGLGRLETVTDAEARTTIPAVFAVGDGAQIGGARIALARGRLAGLAAARDLGRAAPAEPATWRALDGAIAFQTALWRLFAIPDVDVAGIADDTILCRCEAVTAGALRAEGAASPGALKKATRAGMGRCQGRLCGATVARFAGAREDDAWAAPRAPVKPVPAMALAMEKPEWGEGVSFVPSPAGGGEPGPGLVDAGSADGRTPTPAPPRPAGKGAAHDLLVIGAGVIGLAIARAAAREGLDAIVLDRGEPGQGASTANAGSLHIQLHAFDSAGAAEGPGSAAAQILALGPRAVALWRDIARDAGEALGIRTEGGLMLAETDAQRAALAAKVAMERDFGVDSHLLGREELYARHPWLAPGRFAGAAFCTEEGQMDPLRGLSALLRLTRSAGATIRPHTAVTRIDRDGPAFIARTATGEAIGARRIVNAAGAWANTVASMLQAPIPVRAIVQQVIATEAAAHTILRPLVLHGFRHLSLKQGDAGHLILGGAWPGALDLRGRPRNLRASIEGNLFVARSVLPALDGLHVIRAWTGINVAIPGPILGEDPRLPGLFHAVTYNGWTLAPVIAELIVEALRGGKGPPAVFAPAAWLNAAAAPS
jgi:glycine/D-amino acid oxidase-like deaminating enzyme